MWLRCYTLFKQRKTQNNGRRWLNTTKQNKYGDMSATLSDRQDNWRIEWSEEMGGGRSSG